MLQSFQKLKDEVTKFYNKLDSVSPYFAELEAFSLENIASKMDNTSIMQFWIFNQQKSF